MMCPVFTRCSLWKWHVPLRKIFRAGSALWFIVVEVDIFSPSVKRYGNSLLFSTRVVEILPLFSIRPEEFFFY